MWKKFEDSKPEISGWILLSTERGLAYAYYNLDRNELDKIHILGDGLNTPKEVKHWAEIERQPDGDYNPESVGFPRSVKY